jgi:hypothetical protein
MTGRSFRVPRQVLWYAAFVVVAVLFGLSVRHQVVARAQESLMPLNQWDHILEFLLNPYFIAYFILPVCLSTSCVVIHRQLEIPALLRFGNYRRWLLGSILDAIRRLLPLLAIWVATAALTSVGLPYQWEWSELSSTASVEPSQILDVVSIQGLPAVGVGAIQMGLLLVTLIGCHAVLAALQVLARHRYFTFTCAALMFFSLIYSFRNPFGVAALDIANFFLLHRAFEAYRPVVFAFVPTLATLVLCFAVARYADRKSSLRVSLPFRWPLLIYLALCLLGILYAWADQLPLGSSPTDLLFAAFYGVSVDGYLWTLYLFHSIVFLGFAYLFQLRLTDELDARIYLIALRRGSPLRWLAHFILPVAGRVPLLLGGLLALAAAVVFFGDFAGPDGITLGGLPGPGWILYQFLVNGTLQLLCYVLTIFVVSWVSGRTVAGLFALGAFLVMGLPAFNAGRLLPAALNSLGYVQLGGPELLRITVVLGAYLLVLTVVTTLVVGNRRLFFNERI